MVRHFDYDVITRVIFPIWYYYRWIKGSVQYFDDDDGDDDVDDASNGDDDDDNVDDDVDDVDDASNGDDDDDDDDISNGDNIDVDDDVEDDDDSNGDDEVDTILVLEGTPFTIVLQISYACVNIWNIYIYLYFIFTISKTRRGIIYIDILNILLYRFNISEYLFSLW